MEAKQYILEILNTCWSLGIVPESFKETIIMPIFKNGEKDDPNSYGGVALLDTLGKIYTKIM